MKKLGLKLWSINENYLKEAIRLYKEGVYHYIELFAVSSSYQTHIHLWKNLDIPFVIHAPHSYAGLNTAKKEDREKNKNLINEVLKFADTLNAEMIIFHPGLEGDINEAAYQLGQIKDSRIVVENKPYFGRNNELCNGYSSQDIALVMNQAKVGFCFDIGHAICAANAQKINVWKYLEEFNNLKPKIYHLSDGDFIGTRDEHKHFGEGNFDLKKIYNEILPVDCLVSIETMKNFEDSLIDFEKDIAFLSF